MISELNPKIFDENSKMKSSVRDALLSVVEEFFDNISEEITIPVLDIILVGSNAGFNYTDNSDIDVHIVTDFSQICDNLSVTTELFNTEKSLFNLKYDIEIKGVPVEIYVEDINANTCSNGIYSILRDEWIKFPIYSEKAVLSDQELLDKYINKCKNVLMSDDYATVQDLINELYLMRKFSLASYGEAGEGNLVFKEIRSQGYLDKLRELAHKLKSKELSLENLNGLY